MSEKNSNEQTEVKSEIQQDTQSEIISEEYEVLEIDEAEDEAFDEDREVSGEAENAVNEESSAGVSDFADEALILKKKKIKKIIGIAAAGIAVAVCAAAAVIWGNFVKNKNASAAAEAAARQTESSTVAETVTATEPETQENLADLKLEAYADESSITAKFVDASGNSLTGYDFAVKLLDGGISENEEKVEQIIEKETSQDSELQEIDAPEYSDDNQDGEVLISDIGEGTYTLVAKAQEGFKTPDAAEVTVVRYEVIENILESVVEEDENTRLEDPENNRNTEEETVEQTPEEEIKPSQDGTDESVNKTEIKVENGEYVYTANNEGTVTLSAEQAASLEQAVCLIEENGTVNSYSGLIAGRTEVTVTDGTFSVVEIFLVSSQTGQEDGSSAEYTQYRLSPVIVTKEDIVYTDGWQTIDGNRYYYIGGSYITGWNNIAGIQYYFNESGVLSSKTVIDVSRFNGNIDWQAVKASGIDYAIIRVGYRGWGTGALVLDSMFDENMREATAAGIQVGAYIVTQAINTQEAVEEASFIIEKCRSYNVTLPLVIDVEAAGGANGQGRGDKISVADRTAVINAFAQTVKNAGYTPMVYANKNWLNNYIYANDIVSYCRVWVAQYNSECTYDKRFNMWQFTSSGNIGGISGNVDINAWLD